MTITYRTIKGAPLTADEFDQNFRDLSERLDLIEGIESLHPHGGLGKITQETNEIVFHSMGGIVLGRVPLPTMHFRPRGEWDPQEDYAFYDLSLQDGKTYCCKTAHKSSERFEDDLEHWEVIFAAPLKEEV